MLTDGWPECVGNGQMQKAHTKSVVAAIERDPEVEIIGIGLMSNAPQDDYAQSIIVSEADGLVETIMNSPSY